MLRSTFTKMLRPLEHAVQVRRKGGGGGEWWETIAAFDVKEVAQHYALDCRDSGLAYRVVSLNDERLDDTPR